MTLLEQLARLHGIQTSYYDMTGRAVPASVEAMLAALRSLGAPVAALDDVPAALRERQKSIWQQMIEPVTVIRDGKPQSIRIRIPSSTGTTLRGFLKLESGEEKDLHWDILDLSMLESVEVEGEEFSIKLLPLPGLPLGYHRLRLELNGKSWESLFIAAPVRAYQLPEDKLWGVFLPLYALYTEASWGGGDFTDMQKLIDWVAQLGGGLVATLPFLASFPSGSPPVPYVPATRLFWDELYVDARKIPEFERCPTARELVNSPEFQQEVQALRTLPAVDYKRQMSLKRRVLDELAKCFFAGESERSADYQRFLASHKAAEDYARFRAAGERQGIKWSEWSEQARNGTLQPGDYSEEAKQYHLYAQWAASEQLQNVSEKAKQNGPGLYLDLPVGIHPCSYDVWRERDIFVCEASVGAPPDPVFTSGQNWGFPPMHPEKLRQQGYRYLIDCLRSHLSLAGMLRIDHVMGFHRLFCVPQGMSNDQGLYVRYHAEEFYAILALESQRHKAVIIGEDLGLVPAEVRPAMAEHGLYRMYTAQYELTAGQGALHEVPLASVASLNTHDMFPFSAFWQELDIAERRRLSLVDDTIAQQETEHRRSQRKALLGLLQSMGLVSGAAPDIQSILRGILSLLSASPAQALLVNLEDLWLETQPQNIPGTSGGDNWRRKARYSLEELSQSPQVTDILKEVDRLRKGGKLSQ